MLPGGTAPWRVYAGDVLRGSSAAVVVTGLLPLLSGWSACGKCPTNYVQAEMDAALSGDVEWEEARLFGDVGDYDGTEEFEDLKDFLIDGEGDRDEAVYWTQMAYGGRLSMVVVVRGGFSVGDTLRLDTVHDGYDEPWEQQRPWFGAGNLPAGADAAFDSRKLGEDVLMPNGLIQSEQFFAEEVDGTMEVRSVTPLTLDVDLAIDYDSGDQVEMQGTIEFSHVHLEHHCT
jgi:hypothetical protein